MELMSIPQLARRVGRHRSLVHRLATTPAEGWPAPRQIPGTTRLGYSVAWFDAYWEERARVVRPGKGRPRTG